MSKFHQKPVAFTESITLKVQNIERSLDFYVNKLGFSILKKGDKKVILTTNGEKELLTLVEPDDVIPKEARKTGLYHFALLLPSRKDLGKFLLHFLKIGYPIEGASDHDVSEAIYLSDPDGNGIEIYADRSAEGWGWKNEEVVMGTSALDAEGLIAESEGEQWDILPSETVLGHVHLHVNDLKKAEEFYTEALAMNIVCRYGNQALFVSYGNYHHHIGLNTWNGTAADAPSENSVGMSHFTILYPNKEAAKIVVMSLLALKCEIKEENGVYITKDPSGNEIHIKY